MRMRNVEKQQQQKKSIFVENMLIFECGNFLGLGKGIDGLANRTSNRFLIFIDLTFNFLKSFWNFKKSFFNLISYFSTYYFNLSIFTFKIDGSSIPTLYVMKNIV